MTGVVAGSGGGFRKLEAPGVILLLPLLSLLLASSLVPTAAGFGLLARPTRHHHRTTTRTPSASALALSSSDSSFSAPSSSSSSSSAKTHCSPILDDSIAPSGDETMEPKTKKNGRHSRPLYPFSEARKIARGHGFANRHEFELYECPGAYQLPKNPHEVWSTEWQGWDDFLGVPHTIHVGRQLTQSRHLTTPEDYKRFVETKAWLLDDDDDNNNRNDDSRPEEDCDRLPYRPDLYYKNEGWVDWDDWLGVKS